MNFAKAIKERNGTVISIVGGDGGQLKHISDLCIIVPHDHYTVVEGVHSVIAHVLTELVSTRVEKRA